MSSTIKVGGHVHDLLKVLKHGFAGPKIQVLLKDINDDHTGSKIPEDPTAVIEVKVLTADDKKIEDLVKQEAVLFYKQRGQYTALIGLEYLKKLKAKSQIDPNNYLVAGNLISSVSLKGCRIN